MKKSLAPKSKKTGSPPNKISLDAPGFQVALAAQKNSHCPYSKKKIGAAIKLKSGEIFGGCNVENASYGATVCAERVAVWKAVSEKRKIEIVDVFVVSPAGSPPWPPCGMCRQVLSEFCTDEAQVHCANPEGEINSLPFKEVFPGAFRKDFLHR